jgi:hypothetical protein
MNIIYTLTPEDYIQAQYLHFRSSPKNLILPTLIIILFLVYWLTSQTIPFWLIGAACGYIISVIFVTPIKCRKIFKQQKALHSPLETEITSDFYKVSSALGSASIKWADFHKYKVGKKIILLYQSDVIFHIIPTRHFSEQQLSDFKNILKTNSFKTKRTEQGAAANP